MIWIEKPTPYFPHMPIYHYIGIYSHPHPLSSGSKSQITYKDRQVLSFINEVFENVELDDQNITDKFNYRVNGNKFVAKAGFKRAKARPRFRYIQNK